MKTANQKGLAEVVLLYGVLAVLALLFVPNPVSSAVGVGVRPNKTTQTDATTQVIVPMTANGETLYHKDGSVAMISQTVYRHQDLDQQQHTTFWESILALPRLFILLMILGIFFPGIAAWRHKVTKDLKDDATNIVKGLERAFAALPEKVPEGTPREVIIQKMKQELSASYDQSTKNLVNKLKSS